MTKPKTGRRRGAGRPSAEEAAQLEDRLLDAAQDLFLTKGFKDTTVGEIARAAGSSTQTIYSRYPSKAEVLRAVVIRFGDRARTDDVSARGVDPREYLTVTGFRSAAVFARGAGALNRLAVAEGHRVPELRPVVSLGFARAAKRIHGALKVWREDGVIDYKGDLELAAIIGASLITDRPRIRAMLGDPMSEDEVRSYVSRAVDIFLHGCNRPSVGESGTGRRRGG